MHDSTRNPEAERLLLSCIMIDPPNVLSSAMALGIDADSFTDPVFRELWQLLHSMLVAGEPIDVETVWVKLLPREKSLRDAVIVITAADLSVLQSAQPTTARATVFAKAVRDAAIFRKLGSEAAHIGENVRQAGSEPAADVLRDAASAIMGIEARGQTESWATATKAALADFDARIDPNSRPGTDDTVSFSIPDLDREFGPMRLGQMVVLAARTSNGKSSLARQIAVNAAIRAKQQVLFCSLEVTGKTLAVNMAQTESRISAASLSPRLHPADARDFKQALERIVTPNLDVLAASSVSLASIQARLEVLRAKQTPARLVVVDYIGLMPDATPLKGENRAQSVGRVSRALKRMALENNCVVLVLSQLNRESAKDESEPQMHHLRESGDIEQDADKIILLHRPGTNPQTGAVQSPTSLASDTPSFFIQAIQAKGRDDGTGSVGLNFRRAITRFDQIVRTTSR